MLSAFNSQKFRFWAFVSMFLLVYVHGYNLHQSYLQPWTVPNEPLTFTTFTEYWLANGLFRFRIPMLFIISGYLFAMADYKPYKERADKRVRTLLFPYLVWSGFGLLLTWALELFPSSREIVASTRMMQIDETRVLLHEYRWYEVLIRWIFFPASYQLWFLRVLLIYNLAYPALRWCVTHRIAKWIFFSIVILLWLATAGFVLVEGEGLLFFSLGIWMQKTNFNINTHNKWLNPKVWLVVFLTASLLKTWLALEQGINNLEPVLLVLHKITVLSGLVTAWYGGDALVRFFMDKKWFGWLTAFSFMIYVFHAPLVVYVNRVVLNLFGHWPYYRIVSFILAPLCLIIVAVILGAFMRKWMPKVYGFVTGGRGF